MLCEDNGTSGNKGIQYIVWHLRFLFLPSLGSRGGTKGSADAIEKGAPEGVVQAWQTWSGKCLKKTDACCNLGQRSCTKTKSTHKDNRVCKNRAKGSRDTWPFDIVQLHAEHQPFQQLQAQLPEDCRLLLRRRIRPGRVRAQGLVAVKETGLFTASEKPPDVRVVSRFAER